MLCEPLDYEKCRCIVHAEKPYLPLSLLLLDCWQREYDQRPYKNFRISKNFFEKRMKRCFDVDDWLVVIEFLEKRKQKTVTISYIPMTDFYDENLSRDFVRSLRNVESLELKSVFLPVTFLVEFHKCVTSNYIKALNLSHNELTYEHLVVLRSILIELAMLNCLDVSNCSLNENTFPILADGIHKSRSLEIIDISRPCPITTASIFESLKFANTMAQLLWQNQLTELHLQQCSLNGHDLELFSEYLESTESKLLHLDLQANNITSHGADHLFVALARSNTLRILNLCDNNIGSKGGVIIARYLTFTNIRSLDISHNGIGAEAMYELLSAIKKPCELKILKLYGNEFNPKAAVVLRRLLRAQVIDQSDIDLTYTWNHSKEELCAIPMKTYGRVRT